MKADDYIDMPARQFKNWDGGELAGDEKVLDKDGTVRVKLLRLVYGKRVDGLKVVVEAEGVRKEVDASLFYNYGTANVG